MFERSNLRGVVSGSIAFLPLLTVLVLTPAVAYAEVWENVTVITLADKEYFNVTVENIAGDSTAIIVKFDEARKVIASDKIRVIFDQNGTDITTSILRGFKAPSDDISIQKRTPFDLLPSSTLAPVKAPRESRIALLPMPADTLPQKIIAPGQRFVAMFSGNAGYGLPMGTWFDGMTYGFCAHGSLRIALVSNNFFGFSYRYQALGMEEAYKLFCVDEDCFRFDWDIRLHELYLSIGHMSRTSTPKSPFAYWEVGLGGIRHVMEVTASIDSVRALYESNEWEMGVSLGAGGVFPLSGKIGLNVEGDIRITGKDFFPFRTWDDPGGPNGLLFGFRIGFVAMLGGKSWACN